MNARPDVKTMVRCILATAIAAGACTGPFGNPLRGDEAPLPPRSAPPPVQPIAERSPPPVAVQLEGARTPRTPLMEAWSRQLLRDQQERLPLPVFARVTAPAGSRVVFYNAGGLPHASPAATTVGLRSRNRYAFSLENLTADAGKVYFGTIEVLRGPRLINNLRGSDSPIPILFDDRDVAALFGGGMITKIIVLEDPDLALPVPGVRDEPIVYEASPDRDPIDQAKQLGKMVLVVRIGNRVPTRGELVGVTAPGTLLMMNEKGVEAAAKNEKLTAQHFQLIDSAPDAAVVAASHKAGCDACASAHSLPPVARAPLPPGTCMPNQRVPSGFGALSGNGLPGVAFGPGHWMANQRYLEAMQELPDDEYLCDGGDRGKKVGADVYGKLVNLDAGDTVADFRDKDGRRRFAPSNTVCVYVPRYAEVRFVQNVEGYERLVAAENVAQQDAAFGVKRNEASQQRDRIESLEGMRGRQRASGYVARQWSGVFAEVRFLAGFDQAVGHHVDKNSIAPLYVRNYQQLFVERNVAFARVWTQTQSPIVLGSVSGLGEVLGMWKHGEIDGVEEKPGKPGRVKLEKSVNAVEAKLGDVLDFVIKYTNMGDETVTNLAVVDNLPPRLEYVPGSAAAAADSVFTAESNELGSQTLRWEVKPPLKGRQFGAVHFKAKVR